MKNECGCLRVMRVVLYSPQDLNIAGLTPPLQNVAVFETQPHYAVFLQHQGAT